MNKQSELMRLIRKKDTTFAELHLVTKYSPFEISINLFSLKKKGKIRTFWKKNKNKSNNVTITRFYSLPYNEDSKESAKNFSSCLIHNKCQKGGKHL